jgi:DNA-3-methyladenine glycosylase II
VPHAAADVPALIVKRDRAFARVVASTPAPPAARRVRVDDRFATLVRSITFQLLAGKAATTIHDRVRDACGGVVTPESVRHAGEARLRQCGLNRVKASAMLDLAEHVSSGALRLGSHGRLGDDEIVAELTAVRGIGPWTAEMYLMFTLGRPDVWPVSDLGVRAGWTRVHGLDERVSPADLREVGGRFEGFRSTVAWYCWNAVAMSD